MIAVLASIGFALTKAEEIGAALSLPNHGIQLSVISFVLFLLGWMGVYLLWRLDIRIYHRLLDAAFFQAIRMELIYDFIPDLRVSQVSRLSQTKAPSESILAQIRHFYNVIFCFLAFGVLGSLSSAAYILGVMGPGIALVAVAFVVVVLLGAQWRVLSARTHSKNFEAWIREYLETGKI